MKTVIFDLGGVCLSDYLAYDQRKSLAEKFNLDFEKLQEYHIFHINDIITGKINETEYLTNLFRIQNKTPEVEKARNFLQNQNYAHEEVLRFIISLSGKCRLAAFTNEIKEAAKFRIKKFDLKNYFTKIFVSSEIGYDKISSESFAFVLKKLNACPKDTIFIDNKETYVNSAKKIGIIGIHFKDLDRLKEELLPLIKS